MVKFSKQLESQLVPEWKSAFCNYWKLKKELKHIRLSQSQSARQSHITPRRSMPTLGLSHLSRRKSMQEDTILVSPKKLQEWIVKHVYIFDQRSQILSSIMIISC
ncbi:hypothetical protein KP509_03G054800 [Ceratopteris richardii]|uniref:SPX domain-containing protein n=1 Tax=Ceratopteris richardii TaxID=49495 RepID=A0A8T2V455_CERRI|nr:hypothetical protein KP509_03G054800 [Ceratopteris richardii]